jgi:hypothetical protein
MASNSGPSRTASGAAGQHVMKIKIRTLAMFAPLKSPPVKKFFYRSTGKGR